jgi:hypothetical protein
MSETPIEIEADRAPDADEIAALACANSRSCFSASGLSPSADPPRTSR